MKYKALKDFLPIIKDREAGLTFQDIADKLGATRQRAEQIYQKGMLLKRTQHTDPFWGLPTRAVDTFERLGLRSKAQVKRAVERKDIHPMLGLPNYRWKTHNIVLAWLKMPELNGPEIPKRVCPKCGHRFQ